MSNARNLGNITTGGATGATTASVTTSINNLIDAAPGALNTLNELAAALGDDANFSTTVTNSIATKLPLSGGTLTGNLILESTDAGSSDAPSLELYRNSASPAVNDLMGHINFTGEDLAGNKVQYAEIESVITDPTDGSEDGLLRLRAIYNGTPTTYYNAGYGANFFYRNVALHTGVNLSFEGSTNDTNETTLTVVDPTADRTITFPDASGTVALLESNGDLILNSTDTSNNFNPSLILNRVDTVPADFGNIGEIDFKGTNDNSEQVQFARISGMTDDISDGTEDGRIRFNLTKNGTSFTLVDFDTGGVSLRGGGATNTTAGYFQFYQNGGSLRLQQNSATPTSGTTRLVTFPDASGTVALMGITNSGNLTASGAITANTTINVGAGGGFYLKQDSSESTIRSESQPIVLQTYASGAWQDRVAIANDGDVGIGTTGPLAQLEIDPPAVDTPIFAIRRQDHASVPLFKFFQDSSVAQGTGHAHMNTGNRDLSITADANSTKTLGIYLMTTGNVGIGTTVPTQKLTVSGGVESKAGQGSVNFYATIAGSYSQQNGSGGTAWAYGSTGGTSSPATSASTMFGFHHWNGSAWSNPLNLKTDGNIGIGTDNPGAKLTITDENAGQPSMQIRNFNTSATGGFTNAYNVEIRSATSTTTHGMLIHLNENNIGRRALDIADSVGAQGDTIFASFAQGKVGINNTGPIGQLDIVVPQDKVPLVVRSGGKSNIGYNAGHVMHCHNSISSSGTWYDVCYVSHSPNIFILGSTVQNGSAHLGGSRWCSRMYGTYGSVAHTTFGGGTRTVAMNGGAITGLDYRYLNSGASSGSYRLQVYVTWSGSISSMEVYTTVFGNGADTLQEDN